MKIVFTGGGTGGHFYPMIAVVERVNKIIDDENILGAKLYYFSDSPYDKEMLFANGLQFEEVSAGKRRLYSSSRNFLDLFKIGLGTISAIFKLFSIYPDVVFGKGGYASFPTILAARLLGIPVMIHESDTAPGRVNKWAGKFAKRVAVSFKEAGEFFPAKKVAWTGQPILIETENRALQAEALEYFKFESKIPVVVVFGGSQGAELINNTVLDALPRLVQNFQIIHQVGVKNFKAVKDQADVVLLDNPNKLRYLPMAFLNPLLLKMAAGAATLIVGRSGSFLFEFASWGLPSILIPITNSHDDHQRKNAYSYARAGACEVVEENNMTANILASEIERITGDERAMKTMAENAKAFHHKDAAEKIARELANIALSHEK